MKNNIERRREKMESLLKDHDSLKVNELAKMLDVTPETIRKDLDYLERRGLLVRSHGTATIVDNGIREVSMEFRSKENTEVKRNLSTEAFSYIKDGMVIYVSSSSTSFHLAKLLRIRKNLTIFTNSLDIADLVADSQNKVILLGGEIYYPGRCTKGLYSLQMFKGQNFDLTISGMDGCKGMKGPGCANFDEAQNGIYCIKHSRFNILLADSSKFKTMCHYQWADFEEFDVLISDKLEKEDYERINIKEIIDLSKK